MRKVAPARRLRNSCLQALEATRTFSREMTLRDILAFLYRANDGTADGNLVTVSLTVTPVNDAPTTVADAYSVAEDATLIVPAPGRLANDVDIDGDALTAVLVSGPANGVLTPTVDGGFSYTPNADFNGADSFSYKANDGTADGNTVTVSLTITPVNDAPVANADAGTADEDTPLTVAAAAGVLANDTDIDGPALSVSAVVGGTVGVPFMLPSNALLTLNADGSYIYNPNGQFESLRPMQTASDSFTYTVSDGAGGTSTATATITINGANEVPVAAPDTYNNITGNTPYAVSAANGLLANDDDPDQPAGDLAVTHVNGTDIGLGAITLPGGKGTVTVNPDGSFTYVPATDFTGTASFTYTVADLDGGTDTETVTLNVTDQIWYVNANYGGGDSDGSYLKPFLQLTQLNGVTGDGTTGDDVDDPNDRIFVFNAAGGGTLTGGVTLESGQKLFGDGHELVVNGIQIGAAGVVTGPTINHAVYGVSLSSNNEVRGSTSTALRPARSASRTAAARSVR